MSQNIDFAEQRAAIIRDFPELTDSEFRPLTAGWHSVAVDVNDRLIFKFPRHEAAQHALIKEASLLALVRPAVTMPVP
ncbi:aminoglycoside phosphotransferase family protein, partial [Rhizobiaceae sp. 2RAB30]